MRTVKGYVLLVIVGCMALAAAAPRVAAEVEWSPEPDMIGPGIEGVDTGLVRINGELPLNAWGEHDDDTWEEEGDDGMDGDDVTLLWECSTGTWKNGDNTGSSVTWIAPSTPSAQVNDVWIKVTASDAAVIPPGDTGDRDDEDVSDIDRLTVWNATITKCVGGLLTPTSTRDFTCTLYPSNLQRRIRFLLGSTSAAGYCMNAGTEDGDDNDLKFKKPQSGFEIDAEPDTDNWDTATTTTPVNSATVTVNCYDYGPYGNIKADIILQDSPEEVTELAYVVGEGTTVLATIPLDDDYNYIADAWTYNSGSATDDADNDPSHGSQGDGLSRFEEYRGFEIKGTSKRLNPNKKDLFIYDEDGIFSQSNFEVASGMNGYCHCINSNEYSAGRVVNFNSELAHNVDQHGLRLRDYDMDGGGVRPQDWHNWGESLGANGPPGNHAEIRCDLAQIEWDEEHDRPDGANSRLSDAQCHTITHELGHGVSIPHHSPGTNGGVTSCAMRYVWPLWWNTHKKPDPPGFPGGNNDAQGWNGMPIGTGFCDTTDNCKAEMEVSDG